MKIFLGDLVHTWEKVSLWTFPLNVGYIGEYAAAQLDESIELRLFKRPERMIEAIRNESPDVVGLSFYVWNENLNRLVLDIAKRHSPRILTIGGGPIFTNINATKRHARTFFERTPSCDAFVVNQGERGFAETIAAFLDLDGDIDGFRRQTIPGTMVNDLKKNDAVQLGPSLDIIRDLDAIPSPYLSGLLDSFFDEPFVPILETNRSCPYRCTFCAWGIGTGKLAQFSSDRVFSEIEYIGQRCTKSMNMFIADANFSILERDVDIARALHSSHEDNGYPGHIGIQWNKSRPDRVLRTARELRGISEVGASMQSLNPAVLEAIKRRNLPLETVTEMVDTLKTEGIDTHLFTELILGLPNETWASHVDANKRLIDLGAEVFNYNLHLLPGTEMDTEESRTKYFTRTGWRLHDNAFGIYDGAKIFEGQEVVLETSTMSLEELRSFRFIHFLIQFMWSRKWYYDFLLLFRQIGFHPVDVIVRIAEAFKADTGDMGVLYRNFKADHDLENFETIEDLTAHWSQSDNLERLRTGDYGKLNYQYTYNVLLEHYNAFNDFLIAFSNRTTKELDIDDAEVFKEQCAELIEFSRTLRISLAENLDSVVTNKYRSFRFDLLSWRESGYQGRPARISTSDRFDYEFYLPNRQQAMLERQLQQFRSSNVNLTLRKMSEEMNADDFFYKVRSTAA